MASYKQTFDNPEEETEYNQASLDFDEQISPRLEDEQVELKRPESLDVTAGSVWEDTKDVVKSITPISFVSALMDGKSVDEAHEIAKYDYNKNVAQVVRDGWGLDDKVQNKGAFYQPDEVIDPKTGVMQRTGNKHFNDYTDEELAYLTQQYEKETGDKTYYEMMNPAEQLIKKGYSSERHGVYDRYKNDPNFANWVVTKNTKSANADFVERIQHGQRNNVDARLIGKENYDDYEGLVAGRTEVYKDPSHPDFNKQTAGSPTNKLFGKTVTGTEETDVQKVASIQVQEELDPDQKIMASKARGVNNTSTSEVESGTTDIKNLTTDDINAGVGDELSTADFIKQGQRLDEENGGSMGWSGAYSEESLTDRPQYQHVASDLGTRLFGISSDLSPKEQAIQLNKEMSKTNWNIAELISTAADVSKMEPEMSTQLADALEMYMVTDTSWNQVGRGLAQVAVDPTTWATIGVSNAPKTMGKKAAMKTVVAMLRQKALGNKGAPNLLKGTFASKFTQNQAKLAAVEGSIYGGIDNAAKQKFKMDGHDKDFSASEFLTSTAIGAVAGFGLGGLMSGRKNGEIPEFAPSEVNAEIKKLGNVLRDADATGKDKRVAKKTMRDLMNLKTMLEGTDDVDMQNQIKATAVSDFIDKGYLKIDSAQRIKEGDQAGSLESSDYRTDVDGEKRTVKRKPFVEKKAEILDTEDEIAAKKKELDIEESKKGEGEKIPETEAIEQTKQNDEFGQNPIVERVDPVTTRGEEVDIGAKDKAPDKKQKELESKTDTAGRNYYQASNLTGPQGGKSGVAQTKVVDNRIDAKDISSARKGLEERTKAYKEKRGMEDIYDQNEAKPNAKGKAKKSTIEERAAEINDFQRKETQRLMSRPTTPAKVRAELRKDLRVLENHRKNIRNKGVKDEKMTMEIEDRYNRQFKTSHDYDSSYRQNEIKSRYNAAKGGKEGLWQAKVDWSPYGKADAAGKQKFINNMYKSWRIQRDSMENEVAKAEDYVKKQLGTKGTLDDLSELPERGVDMDKVALIQEYRDLNDDMMQLANKQITYEEAMFRHHDRMDANIKDEMSFLMGEGMSQEKAIETISKQYEEVGTNLKNSSEMPEILDPNRPIDKLEPKKPITPETKAYIEQKKKAEQLEQMKYNDTVRAEEEKKFQSYIDSQFEGGRRTAANRPKVGHEIFTIRQQNLMRQGIPAEDMAEMMYPQGAHKDNIEYLQKIKREQVYRKVNDMNRMKLGINESKFLPKEHKVEIRETMIDASNSMLQVMTVLTGSRKMGDYSKLTGGNLDIRTDLGVYMEETLGMKLPYAKDAEGKPKNWKAIIKPLFMTENYGRGETGLVNSLMIDNKFSRELAQEVHDGYQKAMDAKFPDIGKFKKIVNERMDRPDLGSEISWTLPDNKKVTLKIESELDGTYSIRGVNGETTFTVPDLNTASKSLMPQYIQSYDAYLARQMRKQDYITNHDAFIIPKGKTAQDAHDALGKIMADMLAEDNFGKNMKEMGHRPDGKVPGKGDMTVDDIMNSPHKMEVEHGPEKGIEDISAKEVDNSKVKTDEELMRDFMASSNFRNVDTHSLMDAIINDIGMDNDFAKAYAKDDPFERMAVLAYNTNKYDAKHAIKAPKGVDQEVWDKAQRNLFYEARAKLEQSPNTNYQLDGDHIFFQKNGKPIGDNKLTRKEIEQMVREEDYANRVEYNKKVQSVSKEVRANIKRLREEIIAAENKKGQLIYDNLSAKDAHLAKRVASNYPTMARKVKTWGPTKPLTQAENLAMNVVVESRRVTQNTSSINSLQDSANISMWGPYYEQQVNFNKPVYKQLQELQNISKKYSRNVAKFEEETNKLLKKWIPEDEREAWTKHLLDTDFAAIHDMDKKTAKMYMKENADVYQKAKAYIDKASKALNKPENQKGFYHNNGLGIAKQLGMPKESAPVIEKMISIKAMTNEAWDFTKLKQKDPEFKAVMEMIIKNQDTSKHLLFKNNPESWIKGFTNQVLNDNLTLNENGKVVLKTDYFEQGALPTELETKKRGRSEKQGADIPENFKHAKKMPIVMQNQELAHRVAYHLERMGKSASLEDIAARIIDEELLVPWAQELILPMLKELTSKKVKKNYGKQDFYIADLANIKISGTEAMKVATGEIRDQLGRTQDFTDIVSKTIGSTRMKVGRRMEIGEVKQGTFDLLFSKKPKDDFVELTKEEASMLPPSLAKEIQYINPKLKDMLLGREGVALTKTKLAKKLHMDSHAWKVADKMLRDITTRFKKNNVLSNSTSHINALAFNQTIAPSIGIDPYHQVKYQTQAATDMYNLSKLWPRMAEAKARGNKELSDKLWKQIQANELYQFEMAGLATNAIDGINMQPDVFREIAGKYLGGSKAVNVATKNLFSESDSLAGQMFAHSFTAIDTTGRFMAAKHYESQGMSMTDAARKANGLFGDMDQIAPMYIDFLDKYPIAPFTKWFSRVAPMMARATGEKPHLMLPVAMAIYALSAYSEDENSRKASGVRVSGINPLESVFDFLDASTTGAVDGIINEWNRNVPTWQKAVMFSDKYLLPGWATKPINSFIRTGNYEWYKYLWSNRPENYPDIKGSPLNLKSPTQEFLDEKFNN